MAKMPTQSAAPKSPMPDDDADTGADDQDTSAGAADQGDDSDEPGDENVLLTVCKESDGTYSLIKGDEEDADGADAAGSADVAGSDEASNKQTFDSIGALLKGILDILNEDKSSEGADGSSDDQFQAGFSGATGGSGAAGAAMPQKY